MNVCMRIFERGARSGKGKNLKRIGAALLLAALVCALPSAGFAAGKRLRPGTTISVMGDSISTYTGWSDKYPITDESCTNRYGEAYYGPKGGDFHNTDMTVNDTWWHQAATQLGGEILMSNAGNSTGVFYASYPANAAWDQYLKEMLAWKSRPDYMGRDGRKPDIIALYIGSKEAGGNRPQDFGSIKDVDFDQLIKVKDGGEFGSGSACYTYAVPQTITEAYCILMHKISVNYPDAEIYCFTAVPQASGPLKTGNKRLAMAVMFKEMVLDVAAHYGAHVVDLLDTFQLDPDGDGVAVQEDWDAFKTYFHEDPHPNAAGFDVITEGFVSAVLANSRYIQNEPAPEATPVPDTLKLPKTGDSNGLALWLCMLLAAMGGAVLVRRARNRA